MSFFDSVFDIGKSVVKSAFGGGGGGSSSSTVIAPQYGDSLIQPLSGASGKVSQTQRRSEDPTQKAETVREKAGDDPVALSRMWNDFLKELDLDETG